VRGLDSMPMIYIMSYFSHLAFLYNLVMKHQFGNLSCKKCLLGRRTLGMCDSCSFSKPMRVVKVLQDYIDLLRFHH
jgi:hypothetical protein